MSNSPRILYFGRLIDVTGKSEETHAVPNTVTDTSQLRDWLDSQYGATGALLENTVRIAINSEIVAEPAPLSGAREIAFMPPVGGG
ncbi:MAG: MoaD/ThiS family protein [Pseudomonadota bacterium]